MPLLELRPLGGVTETVIVCWSSQLKYGSACLDTMDQVETGILRTRTLQVADLEKLISVKNCGPILSQP